MVLAPSNLVHEIIPLIGIWELRVTSSWPEPPLESLSRYIGLWGRLLIWLHGYGYYMDMDKSYA